MIVLVDDELVADQDWAGYVEGLWDGTRAAAGRHRIFPVQLSPNAFSLSDLIVAVNYIRPLGTPPADIPATGSGEAAMTRVTNAVVHELCRLLLARPRVDHAAAAPAPLPPDERLMVFISHTKADGVPVAQAIKQHIQHVTH